MRGRSRNRSAYSNVKHCGEKDKVYPGFFAQLLVSLMKSRLVWDNLMCLWRNNLWSLDILFVFNWPEIERLADSNFQPAACLRPESHFALELWLDSENYMTWKWLDWLHLRDLTWLPTFVTWVHDFCLVLFNNCMHGQLGTACLYRPRGPSPWAYEASPYFRTCLKKSRTNFHNDIFSLKMYLYPPTFLKTFLSFTTNL